MKTNHNSPKHLQERNFTIKGVIKYIKNSARKEYTAQDVMEKIQHCLLASSIGVTSLFMNSLVTLQPTNSDNNSPNKQAIYEELRDLSIQKIIDEINEKDEIDDKDGKQLNKISIEAHNNSNTSLEENVEPVDEIETIYGGEFSASENGIRTEEEILYIVNQTNWSQEEKDHIKNNLMEGLLYIQKKYDMDVPAALAILHHEGFCGLLHYKEYGHIRVANIQRRKEGEIGVIGYFEDGDNECLYATWFVAVVDFANYVRTSEALEGATTWYELEFHNDLHIFNGASTEDRDTYNILKEYANQYKIEYAKQHHIKEYAKPYYKKEDSAEVTISDISQAVEVCTEENTQQITESITSKFQNENEEKNR